MVHNMRAKKAISKRMTLLHIMSMLGVTIFFAIFFQLDWVPQWIQENIHYVPQGQMLAYGGYFGVCLFILTGRILTKKNLKVARTKSNVIKLVGKVFHDYTTMFVDLVTITVITYTFFIVGFGLDAESELFWSTFCSFAVFPYLAFFSHWALHRQKLDYTIPIFSNRIR